MASSENLATMEPWMFRSSTFADSWISEFLARDTETLTKALQKSLSDHSGGVVSDTFSPFLNAVNNPEAASVQTPSSVSGGSDHETAGAKNRKGTNGPTGGRITKRKSRASKRTTTTFIAADPANFRQMVQQVTGIRFPGNGQLPVAPLVKPKPKRPVNWLQGCLHTLDTSAFLLGHNQQVVDPTTATVVQPSSVNLPVAPPVVSADGVGGPGFDFDSFSGFPTLESWKLM